MRRSREPEAAGDGHDTVLGVGAALRRHKLWIIVPTLLAFFASLAFVTLARPRYSGEARVLLENRETAYSRADRDTQMQNTQIDAEAVASQVQNIMSRDLAQKVVRDMGLANNPEFNTRLRAPGLLSRIFGRGLAAAMSDEDRAVDAFLKRLLAFPQGKSRVISIEFQAEDPRLAAEIANRLAAEYLLREEGAKSDTSRNSSEWLERAIDPLVKKVQAAEARVEAFRASKGLFVGAGGSTISTQQLGELNTQLTNARAQQVDLQARARLIREAVRLGRVFETSEVNNNELVRRLLEQRAALKAQIALEERTLLPGHPRMRELAAQLGDLEGQIRAAAERAARALENDARVAGARVASMRAEIDSQKKSAALSNEDEVQLKALERDASTLREQLNSYRLKHLDAAARAGESAHPADARIISRAFPASEPTFPKKVPVVLLATLGTLALSSILIATNALMLRATAAPDFAAAPLDPWGYGAVPPAHAPPPRAPFEVPPFGAREELVPPAADRPATKTPHRVTGGGVTGGGTTNAGRAREDTQREAMAHGSMVEDSLAVPDASYAPAEDLARELAMMDMQGAGRVVLVLALESEPMLGLIALRCARRLARSGAALMLDLVGQGSESSGDSIYTRLLPPGAAGLAAYLDQAAVLGDIIHRDSRGPMHIIPAGGPVFQRMGTQALREQVSGLIEALRRSYSEVVIDAGVIGGPGEAFAHHADAIVLITRRADGDSFLIRAVEKLEALRDAPVFVVDEGEYAPPPRAADDYNALAAFSRA